MSTNYKGHALTETTTSTDTARGVKNVFEITGGDHAKRASVRPFLTSAKSCRDYINSEMQLAAYYAEQRKA